MGVVKALAGQQAVTDAERPAEPEGDAAPQSPVVPGLLRAAWGLPLAGWAVVRLTAAGVLAAAPWVITPGSPLGFWEAGAGRSAGAAWAAATEQLAILKAVAAAVAAAAVAAAAAAVAAAAGWTAGSANTPRPLSSAVSAEAPHRRAADPEEGHQIQMGSSGLG
eukprot:1137139-Pelagomonas_calceolata.AAC.2